MSQRRSTKVIMSNEARVLRDLRLKMSMTMKAAGKVIGCSDSFISHVETGRVAVPSGERMLAFLKAYGDISGKYFRELVREYEGKEDDLDVIVELLPKLKGPQRTAVRTLVEQFLSRSL